MKPAGGGPTSREPSGLLVPGHGRILVAFSGGPDSVCLAAQLKRSILTRPLSCIHVDHGLDSQSGQRAMQAAAIARSLGLDCLVERVAVDREGGVEAGARKARYAVFSRLLQSGETLVTAHHADDQAETILMRLLRGAGPGGLAGIPRERVFGRGLLARPLLDWTRSEIMAWLENEGLEWVSDPANRDPAFDRNFIRHEIMPRLRERWPGVVGAIRRTGRLSEGAADAVIQTARLDLANCLSPKRKLSQDCLALLPTFRQAEMLRYWCRKESRQLPPGAQLDEFLSQLEHAGSDRQPMLRWEGQTLHAYDGWLWLDQDRATPYPDTFTWTGSEPLTLPSNIGRLMLASSGASITPPLTVRFGQPGERIRLPNRAHRHAVKKLMSEAGIPPWQRALWPRLWQDERLVAVGQRWLDAEFVSELADKELELAWKTDLYGAGAGLEYMP
ncbi:MAG: tRNA lysidine(34) synthetase TilS [Wenzhouxiangella sp.]